MSTVFGQGKVHWNQLVLPQQPFCFGYCRKAKFKIKKLSELIWWLSIARRDETARKKSPDFCTGFPVCIQKRIIEG
jgi:hypothetical protein